MYYPIKRKLIALPRLPLFAGCLVWIVLAVRKINLWDGDIISYAFQSGRHSGIKMQLMDADLESVYYLIRIEFGIAHFFNLSFEMVDHFLVAFSISVICVCLYKIMNARFSVSSSWSNFTLCVFLTFPVWHVLASTTQTFYVFFLAICMSGMHLVFKKFWYSYIFGFLLILVSFEMNSLLMFAPVLAVLYAWTDESNNTAKKSFLLPVVTGMFSIGYWTISRSLSVPSGQYVGYNKMVQPFTSAGWGVIKQGFSDYSTFFVLPLIGISITCAAATILRSKFNSLSSDNRLNNAAAILVVPLLLASIFPYAMVYKSTPVDDFDWLGRHAILLSIPFSMTLTFLFMLVVEQLPPGWRRRYLGALGICALLIPQGVLLGNGFARKFERGLIDQEIIKALRPEVISPGVVEIVGLPLQVPDHRVYESNYIFYRAFGEDKWWTRIGPVSDSNFVEPIWKNDSRYQEMFIYEPPTTLCRTVITVEQLFKNKPLRKIKVLLNLHVNSDIVIKSIHKDC